MREILFRGKRVDNGEWETGSLVVTRMWCSDESVFIADKMTGVYTPVDSKNVGQYTGLKDKNGKRIFEGDIIINPNSKDVGVIRWYPEYCAFMIYCKTKNSVYWLYDNNFSRIVVIGNIYDNPELM